MLLSGEIKNKKQMSVQVCHFVVWRSLSGNLLFRVGCICACFHPPGLNNVCFHYVSLAVICSYYI